MLRSFPFLKRRALNEPLARAFNLFVESIGMKSGGIRGLKPGDILVLQELCNGALAQVRFHSMTGEWGSGLTSFKRVKCLVNLLDLSRHNFNTASCSFGIHLQGLHLLINDGYRLPVIILTLLAKAPTRN